MAMLPESHHLQGCQASTPTAESKLDAARTGGTQVLRVLSLEGMAPVT